MASKVRVFKLRNQKEEELQKGLNDLKNELSSLRIAKIAGGTASKLGKIGVWIAHILSWSGSESLNT